MRFLKEHGMRPALLADHLPWAALVAPGVVLNKDGSFTTAFAFRGPDLESSTALELMAVRARLNNALRRLETGWCLHIEARRRRADPYPTGSFSTLGARLVDEERRYLFERDEFAFETDYRGALTWLPPREEVRVLERWLLDGLAQNGRDWRGSLRSFSEEASAFLDLLSDTLPYARALDDGELLTWLHRCVSNSSASVTPPDSPIFLDALLADQPLSGGLAPRLGDAALRVVSVRGLPSATRPGLLDALGELPFKLRWCARWISLSKADAELEIARIRKRWFAKRKGVGTLLREAITREETPLVDTDACAKTGECDGALEALGAEACAFGYLTMTVSLLAESAEIADARAHHVEAALNARGLVAKREDFNAVEAWLGSLPGEPYADVRRPLVSTLNLADLLPASAVWAGPAGDEALNGPPLAIARTAGASPFRMALHVGDVGHAMMVGPTGSGKSALLSFLALQWSRYPRARVVFFDKGRSARAATLAAGGAWRSLEAGQMTPLQPLARIDDPAELAWAAEWVLDLVCGAGVEETPFRREAIWSALASLAQAPCSQRTLTVLCALLQDREAALAIEPFTLAGPWGALLDGAEQDHATSAFDTYELEALMAARAPLAPTLTAMFHALERSFDGAPVLLVLDEAWLFLDQARFAAKIREWLKTLRKKRVAVVFATQSLDDIAASSIAASLIESCPTQIFLPNPRALEPASAELYRAFGLSDRQLELIAFAPPKRAYYWRQPHGQRLFELRLTGAALAICGASTPEDQALIDALVARSPAGAFARDFLKAKGYDHVDQAFDALA
jgi:type IV secretion system protein TrbE